MNAPSQQLLLNLLSDNSQQAIEAFIICEEVVKPYFHGKLPGQPEIADELSTKTIERAKKIGYKYKDLNAIKNVNSWLKKIARYILLEYYRKRNLELISKTEYWKANNPELQQNEEITLLDIEAISDIVMSYLNRHCTEDERKVFLLRAIDNMSFKEIGRLFIPPVGENTLIKRYSRIRKKIKYCIDNVYFGNLTNLS